MSKQYENEIQNELDAVLGDRFVVRCGYSGNSALPMPDVYVRNPTSWDTAIELKKSRRNEITVDYDDFENLKKLADRLVYDVDIVLAYKFSNREIIVHNVPYKASDTVEECKKRYVSCYSEDASEPPIRERESGDVVIEKPSLDTVDSAQAGLSDAEKLKLVLPDTDD